MPEITFNITQENLQIIIDAAKGMNRIPQIVDPEDSDNMIDEFTPQQWAKERWRRAIIYEVKLWKQFLAKKAIQLEDDLVS